MKKIFADIITIGDEILYGQILDTNTQWISSALDQIGVKIFRKLSIADERQEILDAVSESLERSDLVLITGGLGPTKDDITKNTLADLFDMPLELNPEALLEVEDVFRRFGKEVSAINKFQAFLPKGSKKITNYQGTAPGMWFDRAGKVVISMPGVPFEMKGMMTKTILPKIQKQFVLPTIAHRVIRTVGVGESVIAEKIDRWAEALPDNMGLAYLPGRAQVRLRLTGLGEDAEQLATELDEQVAKVLPIIQPDVFGFGDIELEAAVGELLRAQGISVATAESCTGGFLSHKITSVPGSSVYFNGGVIAYSNQVKIKELNVKEKTLAEHGAVSEETAIEMAKGVRKKLNADLGISITGIAGPDGGTEEKPVGTVCLAISFGKHVNSRRIQLPGTRILNIEYAAIVALNFIRQTIQKH